MILLPTLILVILACIICGVVIAKRSNIGKPRVLAVIFSSLTVALLGTFSSLGADSNTDSMLYAIAGVIILLVLPYLFSASKPLARKPLYAAMLIGIVGSAAIFGAYVLASSSSPAPGPVMSCYKNVCS